MVHVTFETRLVDDEVRKKEEGKYTPKEVDFANFRIPGDKHTIVEKEVTPEEIKYWEMMEHLQHVPALYKAWKEGLDAPVHGTPIKEWPLMSPGQIHQALSIGIRTVEDFASLNEDGCRAFGTGAINLKQKAKIWLETANDKGKLVEEMAAMKAQMELMKAQLADKPAAPKKSPPKKPEPKTPLSTEPV